MSWKYKVTKNSISCGPLTAYVVLEKDYNRVLSNKGSHSPDGFQMGYGGSGPSDLAYSILIDYFLREIEYNTNTYLETNCVELEEIKVKVETLYQQFKEDFIVGENELLIIDSVTIEQWLKYQNKSN